MKLTPGSFLVLSSEILSQGHGLRFQALGSSMSPCIPNGSFIHVKPVEISRLRPGDIIFYRTGETLVAHRLLRREGAPPCLTLLTRGDSFPRSAVERLQPGQVLGRVVAVQWPLGWKLRLDCGPGRRLSLLLARLSPFLWPAYLTLRKIAPGLCNRFSH